MNCPEPAKLGDGRGCFEDSARMDSQQVEWHCDAMQSRTEWKARVDVDVLDQDNLEPHIPTLHMTNRSLFEP
ncbi:hypothetical protein N9L68_01040 [bacterium]|nr:hypothetical protein [bacterium]